MDHIFQLLAWGDTGWGDEMVLGAMTTIVLALSSYFLGIILAFGAASLKLSHHKPLQWIADGYTTLVRGVPNLVLVYILFFGLGQMITGIIGTFGFQGHFEPNAFAIGVLTLGLISGGFSTEVIRGGIQAIPRGEIEAARAFGMKRSLIFRRITVPQALRTALPGLGNIWQITLKDTSLVSVMALTEIMRQAFVAGNSTREPFIFFVAAAVLYMAISSVSNVAFDRAERHYSRGVRRA